MSFVNAKGKQSRNGGFFVTCDVCNFPVENGLSNCPNCGTKFFRKSPNRRLLYIAGGRPKQKYKEITNGF